MEQYIFTKSQEVKKKINYSSRWNVKSCAAAAPNAQGRRPSSPCGWERAGKKLPCSPRSHAPPRSSLQKNRLAGVRNATLEG
jgi:hypothetical protein